MKEELKQVHIAQVKQRYEVLSPHLTERGKRIWAAAEALAIGRGGTTIVCEATNLSRVTITKKLRRKSKRECSPSLLEFVTEGVGANP